MTAQDRQAVAANWPVIQKDAVLQGFNLDKVKWTYQQIICPVFSKHILLFFSHNQGVGNVSEFSVVVPRTGKGVVRILPILRRSYALSPPASVNPLSIAIFNGIRAHESPGRKVDWLTVGLCYAALTGTRVELPEQAGNGPKADLPQAMNPLLQIGADGSAVVRFDNVETPQQIKEWALSFDSHGRLLHVAVTPEVALKVTSLP